jgi:protein-disulfide isomerase
MGQAKRKTHRNKKKLDTLTVSLFSFIGLVGIGLIALVFYTMSANQEMEELASQNTISHTKGSAISQIKIVEYADIQCPACAQYHPFMNSYMEEYGNRVNFEYRHFPLNSIHPLANTMAEYSVAVSLQDKDSFWTFLDLTYETQREWSNRSRDGLRTFLEQRVFPLMENIDVSQVYEDVKTDVVKAKVAADLRSAREVGAGGTPTFLVNGRRINTPRPVEAEWNEILGIN